MANAIGKSAVLMLFVLSLGACDMIGLESPGLQGLERKYALLSLGGEPLPVIIQDGPNDFRTTLLTSSLEFGEDGRYSITALTRRTFDGQTIEQPGVVRGDFRRSGNTVTLTLSGERYTSTLTVVGRELHGIDDLGTPRVFAPVE